MKKLLLSFLAVASAAYAQNAPKPSKEPVFPTDVRIDRGVSFLPDGRTEKADLYFPLKPVAGQLAGAVVHIHGGGFTGGRRDAERDINICSNLARHGYVAMSIDYELSTNGKVSWPKNLHDCKTAVRWLRVNAQRLGIDPERIGVIGGSAGGTLASLVALTAPNDGLDPAEPYGNVSCRVRCGVDLYGIGDLTQWHDVSMLGKTGAEDPELYRKASPVTYARAGAPPMLIVHGTADKTVPYHQSELLDEALKKAGVEHELVLIPNAAHTFHLQPPQRDLRPLVLGFFDKHLGQLAPQKHPLAGTKSGGPQTQPSSQHAQ